MKKVLKILVSILIAIFFTACAGTPKSEVPVSGNALDFQESEAAGFESTDSYNGVLEVDLKLEGGSGKATVEPDSTMKVDGDSKIVTLTWSSPNYDYMIVDGKKYLPINTEGNSVFEIPVLAIGEPFTVIGDTVAMSTPHEIEYQLTVTIASEENPGNEDSMASGKSLLTDMVNSDNLEIEEWIDKNLQGEEPFKLKYAKMMTINGYDDGSAIVKVNDVDYYLLTEGNNIDSFKKSAPKGLNIIPINPKQIYVVGTGSMDFFVALDELENVKYSSLESGSWELSEVNEAMKTGAIDYAGKYSAPDFELLKSKGCDLVVENTMITHSPEVLLQLQSLGFPVIIDNSIYEESILGRMEWIKLYGLITGKSDEADEAFSQQEQVILGINNEASSETGKKKIGFFAITSQGTVTIRKSDDNICDIIRLAGGEYGFDDLSGIEGTGSTTIQMEEFINVARDCDILIYNSTISGTLSTKDELLKKCPLIGKCKAYEDDEIYCTTKGFYQAVMELGDITLDVSKIINGQDDFTYLEKLK